EQLRQLECECKVLLTEMLDHAAQGRLVLAHQTPLHFTFGRVRERVQPASTQQFAARQHPEELLGRRTEAHFSRYAGARIAACKERGRQMKLQGEVALE